MLRHGGLSLTACEPNAASEVVPEPEPDNIKAPESTHADQSISEPGVDLNLIDLWSSDQVPTLESLSSSLFPSGDNLLPPMFAPDFLVPSPPLAPCGLSASPLASPPPAESPSPPWPVSASAASRLCIPQLHHGPSALGLLWAPSSIWISLGRRSASAMDFQVSGSALTLHPFGSTRLLLPSGFSIVFDFSIANLIS